MVINFKTTKDKNNFIKKHNIHHNHFLVDSGSVLLLIELDTDWILDAYGNKDVESVTKMGSCYRTDVIPQNVSKESVREKWAEYFE